MRIPTVLLVLHDVGLTLDPCVSRTCFIFGCDAMMRMIENDNEVHGNLVATVLGF